MPRQKGQSYPSMPPEADKAPHHKRQWRQMERAVDKSNHDTEMMLVEAQTMRMEVEEMNKMSLELTTALADMSISRGPPLTPIEEQPNEDLPMMPSMSYELEDIQRVLDTLCSRAENVSMHIDAEQAEDSQVQNPQTPIRSHVARVPTSILKKTVGSSQTTPYDRNGAGAPTPSASAKKVRFLLKKPVRRSRWASMSLDSEDAFFNS